VTSYELVHIAWIDSQVSNSWEKSQDILPEFDELHSVGFLIDHGPDGYVLAGMLDPEASSVNAVQFIPRGCVRKVTSLCLMKTLMT
jgi:hypothetical protein